MRAPLWNLWEDVSSSLWFVPTILVAGSVLLSYVLVGMDEALFPNLGDRLPVLFGGSADGARDILTVIAGSLITVVAVAFSVTLVVIQQAASQYSPRLLRNFTSDRGNQVVLGVYIATFTYALLVMRQVRGGEGTQEEFVPALALAGGIALSLLSLALLIYFIHHTVRSLEITSIINSIRREMEGEIQNMFPAPLGQPVTDSPTYESLLENLPYGDGPYQSVITAPRPGYLRRLDESEMIELAFGGIQLIVVDVRIGEYLPGESEIARAWSSYPLTEDQAGRLQNAFLISPSRTLNQDMLFGLQQIVDVALKALSPGINDPTTAEQCIDELGQILGDLARRNFPSPLRKIGEDTYLLLNRPSFADFVDAAFSQIRRVSQENVHVTIHLLRSLKKVAASVTTQTRAGPITGQVMEVLSATEAATMTEADKQAIQRNAQAVLAQLQDRAFPLPSQRGA
jgi:uncharacterized membrane protein